MLRVQRLVPRIPPRLLGPADPAAAATSASSTGPSTHYLRIAPPEFAARLSGRSGRCRRAAGATPSSALGAERDLVEAEQAEPVDRDRGGELAGDRRRGDPAGADRRDRDQRVGDVDGAEQAAEQVVPADVEGRAEPAGLAAEDDDRAPARACRRRRRPAPPAGCPVALPSPALIGACRAIRPPATAVSRTARPLSIGVPSRSSRDLWSATRVASCRSAVVEPPLLSYQ